MMSRDVAELVALAALWGASFLFMRIARAEFGAVRAGRAARHRRRAGAAAAAAARGAVGALRRHWRPILLVGITNSALPFVCFAYAALSMTAGLSRSSTRPRRCSAPLIAWLWLKDRLDAVARRSGWRSASPASLGLAWDKAGFKPGDGIEPALAIAACIAARALRLSAQLREAAPGRRAAAGGGRRQPAGAACCWRCRRCSGGPRPRRRRAWLPPRAGACSAPAWPTCCLPADRPRRRGQRDQRDLPGAGVRAACGAGSSSANARRRDAGRLRGDPARHGAGDRPAAALDCAPAGKPPDPFSVGLDLTDEDSSLPGWRLSGPGRTPRSMNLNVRLQRACRSIASKRMATSRMRARFFPKSKRPKVEREAVIDEQAWRIDAKVDLVAKARRRGEHGLERRTIHVHDVRLRQRRRASLATVPAPAPRNRRMRAQRRCRQRWN